MTALSLSHGANDMYMGFLPALLPLIVDRLGLSYKGAGALVSIVVVTSQLSQPLFGFLGDRVSRRALAIAGPLLTALSMSWVGLLNSYELLLAALILAGVGTAVFHPQGAALVSGIAPRQSGVAMAIFTAGGAVGFGAGSVLAAVLAVHLGLGSTWLATPIGLAAVAYFVAALPRSVESSHEKQSRGPRAAYRHWLAALTVLYFVMMLRAATATMFTTFVPMLIERRGDSLVLGGGAVFGFSLAGAMGGFAGSGLARRLGRRPVTIIGLALAAPALYLFFHAQGVLAAALLLVVGACVFSALPANIVMGQELVPRHASTVSGLLMGFAWGIGGLGAVGLGALADHWAVSLGELGGLARAMDLIALLPLLAAMMAIGLPETRSRGRQAND